MSQINRRAFLVAGTAAALLGPTVAAAASRLQVSGRRLIYGGRTVLLRGVAVGDPLLGRETRTTADYAHIAQAWNSNVVRLSVHPGAWKHRRSASLAKLDRDVRAALAARMFVIIDWHSIGWPNGWYMIPPPEWGADVDQYNSSLILANGFWGEIARRYGGDGRIAFELWNEPIFDPDDPGDPARRWASLKRSLQKLIATIRQHGQNLVLATGDRWAYDLRGIRANRLGDGNVAYVWHVYAGHDGNSSSAWAQKLDNLQTVAPVLVTEWGFGRDPSAHYNGTAASFGNKFISDFLDARGLHHTAWCWHPGWGPPMLKSDWRQTTEMGTFVKNRLKGYPVPVRP